MISPVSVEANVTDVILSDRVDLRRVVSSELDSSLTVKESGTDRVRLVRVKESEAEMSEVGSDE